MRKLPLQFLIFNFAFLIATVVAGAQDLPEEIRGYKVQKARVNIKNQNDKTAAKDEWTVTGRVFVFGRFKKFGFDFKRVVPVEINLKIKNPLNSYQLSVISYQFSVD